MGWTKKVESLAIFLALSALLFSSVDSSSYDCDLSQKFATINVSVADTFATINAVNLNGPNPTSTQCQWNITFGIAQSFLELSRIVLAPTDSLAITGYHWDNGKPIAIELFNGSGSPLPGLISTETCNYVIVDLLLSKDSFARSYSTIAYWKPNIQLTKDSGLLAFPLTKEQRTINSAFTLQPNVDYSDSVILLNFTQLPKTYSFIVNNQTYSNEHPPTTFLQTTAPLSIEFKNYNTSDVPILTSYWLVSANCSGIVSLKVGQEAKIAVPNEDYRKQQQISTIKCAQIFTSPDPSTKFQVLIDPNQDGLSNAGDSVTFYSPSGSVELSLNAPALMYYRTIENFLTGNQYLVVYDSPYASNTNAKFNPPAMKVISNDEAGVFMLTDKDLILQLPSTSSKIVHVLFPINFATTGHVVVEFEQVSLTPGQMSISIYGSEEYTKPLVTLGQSDRLPLAIAGNAASMRVVYEGKIQPLKVTYRLVAPGQSCQYLSTLTPTFEVKGGESASVCSWYVPPANVGVNHTVINPTILKVPQGKVLTVTTFGTKSTTNLYPGPIDEFYFPDMVWKNNTAYQFSIDVSNVTKEDLHLLLVQKADYLNEQIALTSTKKISTIQSANYPGYYPVGLTQNWLVSSDPATKDNLALITIDDIHLKTDHQLTLVSKESGSVNWKGDVNITGVTDYLVHYPFSFSLDSNSYNLTSFANRGFRVSLQYPGIGADLTVTDKGAVIGFNSLSNVSSNPLNIWRVTASDKSSLWSDTILRINVSLADTLDKTKAKLSIYDSISLRELSLHQPNGSINGTTGSYLGSIKSAFIVYDYSESLATKANFSIEFTITAEKCEHHKNYSVSKCATTDRCITDPMICNGINECGDFTDELYCPGNQPSPPAPSPASSGGVNTLVVIFILMPLAAVLGIVGYIYIPQFLLRIRRGRYSEFRDLSEVS